MVYVKEEDANDAGVVVEDEERQVSDTHVTCIRGCRRRWSRG